MIQLLAALLALAGLSAANPAVQHYEIHFAAGSDVTTMKVVVDSSEQTIRTTTKGSDYFEPVDTLFDYSVKYSATRQEDTNECHIKKLSFDFDEDAAEYASNDGQTIVVQEQKSLSAVPLSDDDESSENCPLSAKLKSFCGSYTLMADSDDGTAPVALRLDDRSRQLLLPFRRCVTYGCRGYYQCTITNVLIPTGFNFLSFFG